MANDEETGELAFEYEYLHAHRVSRPPKISSKRGKTCGVQDQQRGDCSVRVLVLRESREAHCSVVVDQQPSAVDGDSEWGGLCTWTNSELSVSDCCLPSTSRTTHVFSRILGEPCRTQGNCNTATQF